MNDDRTAEPGLDETLEETYPASDAPANTVETGIHVDVYLLTAARSPPRLASFDQATAVPTDPYRRLRNMSTTQVFGVLDSPKRAVCVVTH